MKSFKFFWTAHKWTGIGISLLLLSTVCSGFLLLVKKNFGWIQPPTMIGAPASADEFISMGQMFNTVLALDHPEFGSQEDIDRIDFQPSKRVQVCAVTAEVLSVDWRPSDMIEDIHDGSYFAGWVHGWVMPIVPIGLLFLIFSGIWLWIEPMVR